MTIANTVLANILQAEPRARAEAEERRRYEQGADMQLLKQIDAQREGEFARKSQLAEKMGAARGMMGTQRPVYEDPVMSQYAEIGEATGQAQRAQAQQEAERKEREITLKQQKMLERQQDLEATKQTGRIDLEKEETDNDLKLLAAKQKNDRLMTDLDHRYDLEAMADEYLHKGQLAELNAKLKREQKEWDVLRGRGGETAEERERARMIDDLRALASLAERKIQFAEFARNRSEVKIWEKEQAKALLGIKKLMQESMHGRRGMNIPGGAGLKPDVVTGAGGSTQPYKSESMTDEEKARALRDQVLQQRNR
jgi:hypothetical protein